MLNHQLLHVLVAAQGMIWYIYIYNNRRILTTRRRNVTWCYVESITMRHWPLHRHPVYWDSCCRKSILCSSTSADWYLPHRYVLLKSEAPVRVRIHIQLWSSAQLKLLLTLPGKLLKISSMQPVFHPNREKKLGFQFDMRSQKQPALLPFLQKPAMQSRVSAKTHFIPMKRPLVHTNNVPAALFESKNPAEDKTFSIKLNFLI